MKKMMSVLIISLFLVSFGAVSLYSQDEGVRDETRPGSAFGDMVNAKTQRGPVVVLCNEITGTLLKGVKAKKKSVKNGVTITFMGDSAHLQAIKDALNLCKKNTGAPVDPKTPIQLIGLKGVSVNLSETEGALKLEAASMNKKMVRLIKSVKIKAKNIKKENKKQG